MLKLNPKNMQSLDDILNDMGIGNTSSTTPVPPVTPPSPPEPEITTLSDDDFQDILNAISPTPEPVEEEPEEEYSDELEEEEEEGHREDDSVTDRAAITERIEEAMDTIAEIADELHIRNEEPVIESALVSAESPETPEEPVTPPIIPPNSSTLQMNEATIRFSGTEWYQAIRNSRIIFAGVGGIGSNAVFQIARMAPAALCIYDDDKVEEANMSGQLFSRDDIGNFKTNAIAQMVNRYTDAPELISVPERYDVSSTPGDIMICGFDNMQARRTFYTCWKTHIMTKPVEERKNCLFLDGRLSIDTLQVFCITGEDEYYMDKYEEEYLFEDSEAEQTVCSMKQTTYMACMIGSIMTNLFTNFIANTLEPLIPYNLPFFTEYNAQHMIFKTEK